jgi:hypothetical protein
MADTTPTHHSTPSDRQLLVARLQAEAFLTEDVLSAYPTDVLRDTVEALQSWLDPAVVPLFLSRAQAGGTAAAPPGPRPQAAQRAEVARPPGEDVQARAPTGEGVPPGGDAGGRTEGGTPDRRAAAATGSQTPSLPAAVRGIATVSTVPTVSQGQTVETVETVEEDGLIKVPPFPVTALPESLRTFCESVAEALPCPVDYPATFTLPVVGACIGSRCCIQAYEGWTERPLLWTCVVARSGDRKTPALAKTTAPLDLIEQALPARNQIVTSTCTIPSLRDALRENPEGIIYVADEITGWLREMALEPHAWLSIHECRPMTWNRVSLGQPIKIARPFVAGTGGIQPDLLDHLVGDAYQDGRSARFLASYPDPVEAGEWRRGVSIHGLDSYSRVCQALLAIEPGKVFTLSPPAEEIWATWVNGHRKEQPPDILRPVWAKAEGHCLRLALILFLANRIATGREATGTIDREAMEGATRITDYFKAHSRRVYAVAAADKTRSRVDRLLRYIQARGGRVSVREACRWKVARSSDDCRKLFRELEELGYGAAVEVEKENQRGPRTMEFVLGPGPTSSLR